MFEYSIRDFFECQNNVEPCWFEAFFTQFREAFEGQNVVVACWLRCWVLKLCFLGAAGRLVVLRWDG